jgi:RNA polymerase-binding transcription factor DksA
VIETASGPRSNRRSDPERLDWVRDQTLSVVGEGETMKTNGVAPVGNRIERDLDAALSRLRQLGGAVMVMDLPDTIGGNSAFADEVDQIQVSASRDMGLATRELLQERANRLSAALDRLNEGAYGVCVECAERISPARLDAVPEMETCVRCQATLERLWRHSAPSRRSVFAGGESRASGNVAPPSYRSSHFPNEEDRSVLS